MDQQTARYFTSAFLPLLLWVGLPLLAVIFMVSVSSRLRKIHDVLTDIRGEMENTRLQAMRDRAQSSGPREPSGNVGHK